MIKTGFIGAGTVGTALAVLMKRKGYQVVGVYSRTRASSEKLAAAIQGCRVYDSSQSVADNVDLVFITTPDTAIPDVVSQVQDLTANRNLIDEGAVGAVEILEHALA